MEHGVVRVLPPLMNQPRLASSFVGDESIAVSIGVFGNPIERSEHVRPELVDEVDVPGALEIGVCKHDEERRGVGAAVVTTKRHFSKRRHLAASHFVKNLPRLRPVGLIGSWPAFPRETSALPRATDGATRSSSSAVMIPSRPNGVLNHGIPHG